MAKISGVYLIKNILTGKVYVGSSSNMQVRFNTHRYRLRSNKHHSHHLQSSYNKYGEGAFSFEILTEVSPSTSENLAEHESYWTNCLDALNPKRGYNQTPIAGSVLGYKWSAAARERLSEQRRGKSPAIVRLNGSRRGQPLTADHRLAISVTSPYGRRDHCSQGHRYEEGEFSAYIDKSGRTYRSCLICRRERDRLRYRSNPKRNPRLEPK